MTVRGTGHAKRTDRSVAFQTHAAQSDTSEGQVAIRNVPLDLAPLLAPYRGHGRISLRVERLPHRARLSRGQNNGDRSWSLSLDELDDLDLIVPKDLIGMQTLSIRIISLDGGDGATVAVLDHFTPAVENLKMTAAEAVASLRNTPAKIETANAERVRQELGSVKALLAAQAGALAELNESADAQLAAARLDWQKEMKSQLARLSHTATLQLEESRKAWKTLLLSTSNKKPSSICPRRPRSFISTPITGSQ